MQTTYIKAFLVLAALLAVGSCASEKPAPRQQATRQEPTRQAIPNPSDFFDPIAEVQIGAIQRDLMPTLVAIQKHHGSLLKLSKFFSKVDSSSLLGMDVRDSLLLYLAPDRDIELKKMVTDYIAESHPANEFDLLQLISLRDRKSELQYNAFCFSTVLSRLKLNSLFSMLLPNAGWKPLGPNTEDLGSVIAGNDANALMVQWKITPVPADYDILSDSSLSEEVLTVMVGPPGANLDQVLLKFRKGPIVARSKQAKVGDGMFVGVFDRVTFSPDEATFQTLVEFVRYYVNDGKLVSIGLLEILAANSVQADKTRLAKLMERLVDSVYFLHPIGSSPALNRSGT